MHARDPRKRVDAIPSERHVRVELDGELLAESRRPTALFETGLPTRWYLPAEDVRFDVLTPSDTVTRCPYKGAGALLVGAGARRRRVVRIRSPSPSARGSPGLVCFFNEHVDLTRRRRSRRSGPFTPWSLARRRHEPLR